QATSVTRTFPTPCCDLGLQRRSIPVFRRFGVGTAIARAQLGLAMVCGHLDFSIPNVSSRYAQVLGPSIADPTILRLARAEIGVRSSDFRPGSGDLRDHLHATAAVYTKPFLQATIAARDEATVRGAAASLLPRNSRQAPQHAGDIAARLAWSQSEVRANVLHVPLSPLEDVQSAWKLGEAAKAHLKAAVSQVT